MPEATPDSRPEGRPPSTSQSRSSPEPPSTPDPLSDDPEIDAERAHLEAARAELRRMHQEVVDLDTPRSGAEDNDDYVINLYYKWSRQRRAAALIDMPQVPLFFGRLDYEPGTVYEEDERPEETADRVHVGRRHVHEPGGRPLVIDWRAPVAVPFYRATRDDPQRVLRRRRYGFDDAARLTAYEDEPVGAAGPEESAAPTSEIVVQEIERPRRGPMRDIVATIQPEQDDLVRAPLDVTLCVQGAPGTGKTAVGLHRIAYLLYTERDRLSREGGVAIVGPNKSFLSYIRHVLPALGEVDVSQTTWEELVGTADESYDKHGEDPRTAALKGDARMAAVLRNALWAHLGTPAEGLVYTKGANRYRIPQYEVEEIAAKVGAESTRYGIGRNTLAQRIAHTVLLRMEQRGESPDDRVQNAVARSRPVRDILDAVWPKLTPQQVLFKVLTDRAFLETVAPDLDDHERTLLQTPRTGPSGKPAKPAKSAKSMPWSPADVALLDELADLIDRTSTLGHLVVDEAQDLSAMQLRALGRRCRTATVLGDLAQATTPWATTDWDSLAAHLGVAEPRLTELDRGFRVPAQIIDFAARLLPEIAPGLRPPIGVRRDPGSLRIARASGGAAGLADEVVRACRSALEQDGSVGLLAISPSIEALYERLRAEGLQPALLGQTEDALDQARVVAVPVTLAKGLEFDTVIVVEPAAIVAAEPRGVHRLYVALTRAVSTLHVVHADPLPTRLS